ncbi:MAG TPA: MFS transporter, partial [Rhodocyclaceae bacterium]|nr:MFS transporter [Rhodocyclaceae bacterium]
MNAAPNSDAPVWRHVNFRRFWLVRIGSMGAFQMQVVATGWLIYDLTGSALDLGLVGLVQFIPRVALTLWA